MNVIQLTGRLTKSRHGEPQRGVAIQKYTGSPRRLRPLVMTRQIRYYK